MLIDSHSHIDGAEFQLDIDEVFARMKEAEVGGALVAGTSLQDYERGLNFANAHKNVWYAAGVHPSTKDDDHEASIEELVGLTQPQKVVAIGECGLDYYYEEAPYDAQLERFARHIEAAKLANLPVIVHSRDAQEDTIRLLKEHDAGSTGFNEVSDIAIRLKVLAGEIFKLQTNLEWWKRQMFAVSASGECLDKLASQRGIERKKAMKSTGEITFNISQPCSHDIIIPKGCVVATADLVPIRFVTTEDEEISAGNTLVSVYAEAEQAGSNGNIGLGCAVVPVSVPTEIETVTNREKFTGGCDAETDDELRKRIRDTYINTSNGTNAAYYEQLALTVDGVAKASAVGKVRGVGTVNVYVTGADASLGTNVVAKVQSLLEKQRELNVDVIVANAQRTACNMSVVAYAEDGYSSGEVKEFLKNAFVEYVNSIPIGGTFRLSELGARLIDTGCITNYNWNTDMQDVTVAKSQCFTVGTVTIGVK